MKQICNKRSTISSHRHINSLPIKFSSKSNKNVIQKINKGITAYLTIPWIVSLVYIRSEKITFFVASQMLGILPNKRSVNYVNKFIFYKMMR